MIDSLRCKTIARVFGQANLSWLYLGLNPRVRVDHGIARLARLAELNQGHNPALAAQRA